MCQHISICSATANNDIRGNASWDLEPFLLLLGGRETVAEGNTADGCQKANEKTRAH